VCRFHVAADASSAPSQKPASINLQKWFLSPNGRLNLGFTIEGNLSLCSSCLPLGVPNWAASTTNKHFSGTAAGEKEDFYKGSLSLPIFYFVIVLLTFFTLFLLASFYQKYKKK
jgi:hypothetical protein